MYISQSSSGLKRKPMSVITLESGLVPTTESYICYIVPLSFPFPFCGEIQTDNSPWSSYLLISVEMRRFALRTIAEENMGKGMSIASFAAGFHVSPILPKAIPFQI